MEAKEELTCGAYLRKVREQKGITLDKVSQDSKIVKRLLQAIENDDYRVLPPPVYLKGLIKKYAHYLHLDEEQVLEFYQKSNGRKVSSGNKDILPQNRFVTPHSFTFKIFSKVLNQIIRYSLLLIILVYFIFELAQFILPARIIIFYPPQDLMTSVPELTLSGKVIRTKTLYFQDQEISFDSQGFFKEQITLNPGLNVLEFKAINSLGKTTTIEQKVILSSF
jgi:transcriptional regulator with XRE-family HTH domain